VSRTTIRTLAVLALVLAAGCRPAANKPNPEAQSAAPAAITPAPAITDVDWRMVGLGEQTNPLGAGGKPVTLRFDAEKRYAAGFGGCNRYSASYSLRGDSLSFGVGMSTKMACPDGMELEDTWLKTMPKIVTFAATESTLTLNAAGGPVASFRKP